MEYKKHVQLILFLIFFSGINYSQTKLVVYQVEGNMHFLKSEKDIYVGTIIDSTNTILNNNGSAILLDEDSNTYQIPKKGKVTFNEIKKNKKSLKSKSVSKRYLSYVYKKFLNKEEKQVVYGGVFRGNKILETPLKNTYFNEGSIINFKWKNTGVKTYYLWIVNYKDNTLVSKVKVDATKLELLIPLKEGIYKWTVTKENSIENEKQFNVFEIVCKKEFDKREKDVLYKAKKKTDLILKNY